MACLRQTLGGRSGRPLIHRSYTTPWDTTPAGYRAAQKMSSEAMNRRASSMDRMVRPNGPALVQRSFHSDQ